MWVEVLLLVSLLLLLLYRYVTKNFNKWEQLGIPYLKGYFPMGSHMVGSTGHIILKETLSIGSQKVRAVEHWTMGITIVLRTLQMMRCEQLSIPHLKGHLPMSSH
jgi:hypothetical protein